VSPLKIKIPIKNISRQRCAEEFNSGVNGLNNSCCSWFNVTPTYCHGCSERIRSVAECVSILSPYQQLLLEVQPSDVDSAEWFAYFFLWMNRNATQLSGAAARNSDAISRSKYYKLAVFLKGNVCFEQIIKKPSDYRVRNCSISSKPTAQNEVILLSCQWHNQKIPYTCIYPCMCFTYPLLAAILSLINSVHILIT
jgi:hypothetical protein